MSRCSRWRARYARRRRHVLKRRPGHQPSSSHCRRYMRPWQANGAVGDSVEPEVDQSPTASGALSGWADRIAGLQVPQRHHYRSSQHHSPPPHHHPPWLRSCGTSCAPRKRTSRWSWVASPTLFATTAATSRVGRLTSTGPYFVRMPALSAVESKLYCPDGTCWSRARGSLARWIGGYSGNHAAAVCGVRGRNSLLGQYVL